MKQEYKYGLSFNRSNKSYGNGDEIHLTVRGDNFEELVKEFEVAKKKALSLLAGEEKITTGSPPRSTLPSHQNSTNTYSQEGKES